MQSAGDVVFVDENSGKGKHQPPDEEYLRLRNMMGTALSRRTPFDVPLFHTQRLPDG